MRSSPRAPKAAAPPGRLEFIVALGWRGVVYGAADGLLLSAFPILLVFAALRDSHLGRRAGGLVAVGAVAMAASLAMTAVYHAGYSDFRSDKLRKPVTGDLIWSVPRSRRSTPSARRSPTSACTSARWRTTTTPSCSCHRTEAADPGPGEHARGRPRLTLCWHSRRPYLSMSSADVTSTAKPCFVAAGSTQVVVGQLP